jgi:mono/diheme cytochrome c family protein
MRKLESITKWPVADRLVKLWKARRQAASAESCVKPQHSKRWGDRMAHLVGGILHVPFAVSGYIRGIKPDCLNMAHKGFIAGLVLLAAGVVSAEAAVDYVKEVKPILARNCYKCHGAAEQMSKMRLDTVALALKGGERGPAIVPGKSSESRLIQAVRGKVPEMKQMPMKMAPLAETEIAIIAKWIDEGAVAPANDEPQDFYASAKTHWAYQVPQRPAIPVVKDKSWAKNPIDFFILAKLEEKGIKPSPEADKVTLMRRAAFDLTGLPPTLSEVDAYLANSSGQAYEAWVKQLMASPHFGERWARHWLDAARYGDSNGYSIDAPRQIWKYRDWVINAYNSDMPFDQFTIEQIAGDMLPNATPDQKIATGFHRNTQINQEGGIDKEQFRIESIFDRVATTSTVFLGLTVSCAQCHDHKFDPISHKEYYQMFAFLNNADEPTLSVPTPEEERKLAEHREKVKQADAELAAQVKAAEGKVAEWEAGLDEAARKKLKADVQKALAVPPDKRTAAQKKLLAEAILADDASYKKKQADAAKLKKAAPGVTTTLVMQERKEPRETFLFIKGDFTRPADKMAPGVLKVLHPLKAEKPNRLDFARWLVDKQNPLAARVAVNRIWQVYFGSGIVETENDFGSQGALPKNQALLDWLAVEFMEHGWSQKHIHQLIATSATYRQASNVRKDLETVDPTNKLLARQNRLRLEAELVRDSALSASGLLSRKVGGPSVFPPQPDGVMSLGQMKREWIPSTGEDRYRRGMYTFFWRATPNPALMVFDAPDGFSACTRRPRSNTPLQALTLLNDQAYYELAQALAERVMRDGPKEDAAKIDYAFKLCTSRSPDVVERERLAQLLKGEQKAFTAAPNEAKELVGAKGKYDSVQLASWMTVSRVLLNLDETITRE